MRVLVAGGAGYVGSALVPVLIDYGYDVTVIDLLWFGNNLPKEAKVIQKDLFECTEGDFKEFDACIIMQGLSNDPMSEKYPNQCFIQNVASPAYIAFLAREAGVKRIIFSSSCSIYGFSDKIEHIETDEVFSNFPYGVSKISGEGALKNLITKKFSVISLRKGTICGYSPRMRLDLVLNTMFKFGYQNKKIEVHNPNLWRPILGISDAINLYIKAIQAPLELSGVFNAASGNFTIETLGNEVKCFFKEHGIDIEVSTLNKYDLRSYRVSCNKANKELGFYQKDTIFSILSTLFDNINNFKDFENELYINVKIIDKIFKKL